MKQLIEPDLTVKGNIGECKVYARSVFHIPSSGEYPTAWSNWLGAKYKHLDQKFPDVAILCWFSGFGGAGHVVVYVPNKGFYSSPYKVGTTHAVLPSIADIERIYSVKYVGWSEDIEDVGVASDIIEDMTTQEQHDVGTAAWRGYLHREPPTYDDAVRVGKQFEKNGKLSSGSLITGLNYLKNSAEWKGQDAKIKSPNTLSALKDKIIGLVRGA